MTIEVGVYPSRSEAELAQTALEVEGIQSVIEADDAGGAHPFDLTGGAPRTRPVASTGATNRRQQES